MICLEGQFFSWRVRDFSMKDCFLLRGSRILVKMTYILIGGFDFWFEGQIFCYVRLMFCFGGALILKRERIIAKKVLPEILLRLTILLRGPQK